MKKLFLFMVTLAFCLNLKAGDYTFYPIPPGRVAVYTNITFLSNTFLAATSVTFTNIQSDPITLNHTFQWFSFAQTNTLTIGTNNISIAVDTTIDGSLWMPEFSTNLTGGVTNFASLTIVGKRSQFRTRVTALGTNEAVQQNYMSQ